MPARVCILTDSTAQFPTLFFSGQELVTCLPVQLRLGETTILDPKDVSLSSLPASAKNGFHPKVLPPAVDAFKSAFEELGKDFDEIIVLLASDYLIAALEPATAAARASHHPARIHIVDTQSIGVGLGLLVQGAAEAAETGASGAEVLRLVRAAIPHVYSLFCLNSLTYLYHSGLLDPAQALVGEMLELAPVYILEDGRLVPTRKIRSSRHLVDTLCEFVLEFSRLKRLALIQGRPPFTQEARHLRERLLPAYPNLNYSEHHLALPLGILLGPHSLGLVAMENI